jgi:hypothetical protein
MGSQAINYGNAQPETAIDYGAHAEAPPAGSASDATISAQPEPKGIGGKIAQWAANVGHDLKYGTDLTGVGTVLQKLGAHGLYSGNSEKVGDFMGSLPLGLLKATQGAGELPDQPAQGAKDIVKGVAQAATMPSMVVAPELGAEGAAAVVDAIPSAERAAGKFSDIMGAAKQIPINVNAPGDVALRTKDLASSGGTMPKVVNDFIKRVTDPDKGPLTYEEGRDFYSNATRISADEAQRLTPVMKRQVSMFTHALNSSLQDAAAQVGKLTDYQDAMTEYHNAMRLKALGQGVKDALTSTAAKAAAGAGAGAAGAYAVKELLK